MVQFRSFKRQRPHLPVRQENGFTAAQMLLAQAEAGNCLAPPRLFLFLLILHAAQFPYLVIPLGGALQVNRKPVLTGAVGIGKHPERRDMINIRSALDPFQRLGTIPGSFVQTHSANRIGA